MKSLLEVMNELSAPFLLSEGSLLQLYRSCSVGNSDIDIALSHKWWKEHPEELRIGLEKKGFTNTIVFGKMDSFGYEQAWTMDGIKVDIFSGVIEDNNQVIGLWINDNLYPCYLPVTAAGKFLWRDEVYVRVPIPIESALGAMYGRNFRYPIKDWSWGLYPFITGYCSYDKKSE